VRSLCRRCLLFLDGMKTLDGEVSAVIDAYREMVAGEEASESTEFRVETPMRFPLEVRSGRLMGEDSRKKAIFDVFEDILIELDYEVAERVDGAMVEFDVVSRGNTLLLSYDADESPERMGAREPGCYKARIKLPSGLLKPGRYSISVGTGQLKRRQYQVVENALNFEVEVRTRPPAFLSFHKKRRGLLAMPLQWDTESAEDGALRADAFPATDAGE